VANFRLGMGEQDHALDRDAVVTGHQELLQPVGRLVELPARRTAVAVGDRSLAHHVAVLVADVGPPVVPVAMHRGVQVRRPDRDQPPAAQDQVADLPGLVAVPVQQDPAIAEHPPECGLRLPLGGHLGPQALLALQYLRCRGQRAGDVLQFARFLHGAAQPGPALAPGAGPVPPGPYLRQSRPVLLQRLICRGYSLLMAQAGFLQHGVRAIDQLDNSHLLRMHRGSEPGNGGYGAGMKTVLESLAETDLTYPEQGATRGDLPDGYAHLSIVAEIGQDQAAFDRAAGALMRFDMHRRAGLKVDATGPVAAPGVTVAQGVGVGRVQVVAGCRVVYTVDEPTRQGFGYGTLEGHPEIGEESFAVELTPGGKVLFALKSFSKPATALGRAAAPVGHAVQRFIVVRYVHTLRALAS
jgi:uncharacterized protein (UPF0548 family)